MEEMQKLIGQRQGEGTPLGRPRPFSTIETPTRASTSEGSDIFKPLVQSISEADDSLTRGLTGYDRLQSSLEELSTAFSEVCKNRFELRDSLLTFDCPSNRQNSRGAKLRYRMLDASASS